jgi:hypothetical protein
VDDERGDPGVTGSSAGWPGGRREIASERAELFDQLMLRYRESGGTREGEDVAVAMHRIAPEQAERVDALVAEAEARDRGEGFTGLAPAAAIAGRLRDRMQRRDTQWVRFTPDDLIGVARACAVWASRPATTSSASSPTRSSGRPATWRAARTTTTGKPTTRPTSPPTLSRGAPRPRPRPDDLRERLRVLDHMTS